MSSEARVLSGASVCGWSAQPSDPLVPICAAPATWHIRPLDRGQPARWTIKTCDQHAGLAMADADDWHRVTAACAHPARLWVERTPLRMSGCAMPREHAGSVL